jgi:quercetin dioxygenase-like cupin family protein
MGEIVRIGQLHLNFLATGAETAGTLTLFEVTIPPDARVPLPHYHESVEESVYGLDGTTTFTVAGKEHLVRRGDHVLVPRGVPHHFINRHPENARFLSTLTPALIGPAFFKEVGEIVNAGGPPDVSKVAETMRRHGLVPVLPA